MGWACSKHERLKWTNGRPKFEHRQRQRIFSLASVSRPALRSIPPPIQWATGGGSFPGGKGRPGSDADHSPHLVPRSRMSRSYNSSPRRRLHGGSGTDLLYFYKVWVGEPENLRVGGNVMLERISVKYSMRIWTVCMWLKTGISCVFL
jgi:hypothetical protein